MYQPAQSEFKKAKTIVAERERIGRQSATPERMVKAGLENVEVGVASNVQRVTDAPLERMRKAGAITDREYRAGEMYCDDHHAAAVDPGAPTVDWNAVGGGFGPRTPSMFASQAVADARERWRRLERAFPGRSLVAAVLKNALVHQHSFTDLGNLILPPSKDRKEMITAGKAALRMALAAAADHYRL